MTDTFSRWSNMTGVRRAHAEAVLARPDETEIEEFSGLFIQGFSKRVTQAKHENHTVVLAQQTPGKPVSLVCALIAYPDIIAAAGSTKPFAILREITNRFGAVIHIGATPKRLYLAETVPLVAGENLAKGLPPNITEMSGEVITISLFMLDGQHPTVKCGLCFGICADRYRSYIANPPKP